MKILIHDSRPDRLVAWLAQVDRPGNQCHLANTKDQARFLLMSDAYDLVMLDVSDGGHDAEELGRIAEQRNPACKCIDLPPVAGAAGMHAAEPAAGSDQPALSLPVEAEGAPGKTDMRPRWRQIRPGSDHIVAEASGIRWRVFRRQVVPSQQAVRLPAPMVAPSAMDQDASPLPPPPRKPARAPEPSLPPGLAIGRNLRQRQAGGVS